MADMKLFTESDWSGWAGTEGKEPMIGCLSICGALAVYDAVIIAAANGVHLYLVDKEGEAQYWYTLDLPSQKVANMVAAQIQDMIGHAELIELGFVQNKV